MIPFTWSAVDININDSMANAMLDTTTNNYKLLSDDSNDESLTENHVLTMTSGEEKKEVIDLLDADTLIPYQEIRPACIPSQGVSSSYDEDNRPPKRQRLDEVLTARQLIDDIYQGISRDERMRALWKAKAAFDHNIEAVHDHELSERLDVALLKELALLVCRAKVKGGSNGSQNARTMEGLLEEISHIMEILEMLYRASSVSVGASFNRVGEDLVPLLITVINAECGLRHNPKESAQSIKQEDGVDRESTASMLPPQRKSPHGDIVLIKASKILCHFARVGNVTKELAFLDGLIPCLVNLINMRPYISIPWESRLSSLWTLANLACNPANMQMMVCTPGLVRSLVTIGCRPLRPHESMEVTMEVLRARSISARACFNLSWAVENKVPLSENQNLVEMLAQLSVLRKTPTLKDSQTVKEILLQTRRRAIGAIRNLAGAPHQNKVRLCEYTKGHLLDVLTDAALNDPETGIQDRAFAAIHSLAAHDTAELMIERPALILALKGALLEEQDDELPSKKASTKSHASGTLTVLKRSITPEMDSYCILRDLLEAINPTVTSDEDNGHGLTCAI